MADPTDYLNQAAAVEVAVQAGHQAAELMVLAVKRGQLTPVVLPAPANLPASAIEPVEHRQEGREATPLAIERQAVAQLADALPVSQAVLAHEPRALVENEAVSHQVRQKANEAAKDDGKRLG